MTGDEPLRHIIRPPLPWREATLTVCGRPVGELDPHVVIGVDEAFEMRRRLGVQRLAVVICMTCASHHTNWSTWDRNPIRRMGSELSSTFSRKSGGTRTLVEAELRAVAALIAAHRDEFDSIVDGHVSGGVVTMGDLRKKRSRRLAGGAS